MARRSIWTRAKPCVGLERPHFCTRFRGQIDPRGRSSPRGDCFRCFARECRRILRRNMRRKRVNEVKTVRITLCTFRTATSSANARPTKFILKRFPTTTLAKVTGQNRANRAGAGATPLFGSQLIRPKVLSRSLPPVAAFRCACFFAKGEAASFLAVKSSSSGEVGFTTLLHRNLTCYFTLDRARHYGNQTDESSRRTKLCAAQTAPEAGATPPFDARCVTVAVWSLPPQGSENCTHTLAAKEFCQTSCMRRRIRLVRQDCMSKGDNQLPLLKSQPKQPKSAAIQIRVEEDVKLRLDKYAEFIDSSAAYVVTEALKLLFNKDVEFKSWLGQHTYNSEAQHPSSKAAVSKGESAQLALK